MKWLLFIWIVSLDGSIITYQLNHTFDSVEKCNNAHQMAIISAKMNLPQLPGDKFLVGCMEIKEEPGENA